MYVVKFILEVFSSRSLTNMHSPAPAPAPVKTVSFHHPRHQPGAFCRCPFPTPASGHQSSLCGCGWVFLVLEIHSHGIFEVCLLSFCIVSVTFTHVGHISNWLPFITGLYSVIWQHQSIFFVTVCFTIHSDRTSPQCSCHFAFLHTDPAVARPPQPLILSFLDSSSSWGCVA